MELETLVGGLALLIAAAMVMYGARKAMQKKRTGDWLRDGARLPDKFELVYEGAKYNLRGHITGSLMLIASGSYGQNMLVRVLDDYFFTGLEKVIGSILLIQHTPEERDDFLQKIPACYHDRIVLGYSDAYGGFNGQPVETALNDIGTWAPPIETAGEAVTNLHERRNDSRTPQQILFFWSLGGQAPVALPAIKIIHRYYPKSQIAGITALPEYAEGRIKFAQLKNAFEKHGVVGWVVTDNLLPGYRDADYCISGLLAAMSDAQGTDEQGVQFNNVFALALGKMKERGLVLSIQYAKMTVPCRPWIFHNPYLRQDKQLGYFIKKDRAKQAADDLLHAIEKGQCYRTAQLPIGEPGASIFDMVTCNLGEDRRHGRNDLKILEEEVIRGYELAAQERKPEQIRQERPAYLFRSGNYSLKFGTLAAVIDPLNPQCKFAAIRIAAIKDSGGLINELIAFPDGTNPPYEALEALTNQLP